MPRGRRGRFWTRYYRENDKDFPPPPPPGPPHHLPSWVFGTPPRRGRRPHRHWAIDARSQDYSPPPPRWGVPRNWQQEHDEESQGRHSPEEVCFICDEYMHNHPDVPNIHICGHGEDCGAMGRDPDNDDPWLENQAPQFPLLPDENSFHSLSELGQNLREAQASLELMQSQMCTLCAEFKKNTTISKEPEENDDELNEDLSGTLLHDLDEDLQSQYSKFIENVKQQMNGKCKILEKEAKKIKSERSTVNTKMASLEQHGKDLSTQEKELKDMREKVEAERTRFIKYSDEERIEIRRQWQKLNDEISRLEELHKRQEGRVKLDVGGHHFTTSSTTLTHDPDSMLAAMFSGRHEIKQQADGTVFIDRDGTHFRYILNYLRDGITEGSLPEDQQTLKELLNEAVYYQLTGLIEAIEEKIN